MAKAERVTLLAGERQKGESGPAMVACNDYLRLGPGRKLPALAQQYAESSQKSPPTRSLGTLKKWSAAYDWAARADAFDAGQEALKEEERRRVMAEGLALDYERVRRLVRLADFLESQIYATVAAAAPDGETAETPTGGYPNLWLPDVKQIGSGEFAERVDIVRFNAAILEQFRGALDDIAKETGGRVRRNELTGKDGGPIQVMQAHELTDDELARIAAGGGGGTAEAS